MAALPEAPALRVVGVAMHQQQRRCWTRKSTSVLRHQRLRPRKDSLAMLPTNTPSCEGTVIRWVAVGATGSSRA